MKNTILAALEWRYAVKKYDPSKKISDANLSILKESIRLTPTSYGLQPFQVFIIENPEIREQLQTASYGQTQVTEASHLFVFAVNKQLENSHIDDYLQNVATTRDMAIEQTLGYGNFIKSTISKMTEEHFIPWNSKQTYLALAFLMHTAAEMRIDTTPMEGFDSKVFDEILGLEAKGLTTTVICPIGYRSVDDKTQFEAKVRKTENDIFTVL